MKNIILAMENEELEALSFYLEKANRNLQEELEKSLKELYEKEVPEQAREYIAFKKQSKAQAKEQTGKERKNKKSVGKEEVPDEKAPEQNKKLPEVGKTDGAKNDSGTKMN